MENKNRELSDLEILAKTLYFEAGICDIFEKILIGWVIRNRKNDKRFPNSYKEVCLQPYQFSCWNGYNEEKIKKIDLNGKWQYMICLMVAEYVIHEKEKYNPIPGVVYYYNPQLVCPKWARRVERVYLNLKLKHIFLKDKKKRKK